MRTMLLAVTALVAGCATASPPTATAQPSASPYILVFAGDRDEQEEDFFAVIDVRPGSRTAGQTVSTLPIGMKGSMPHHMEYELPARGSLLFANAHHHEATLLIDFSDPLNLKIHRILQPPKPLRFSHDIARLDNGNVMVGFLRSDGPSPALGDDLIPGGHGGIAEYTATGELLRTASAAVMGLAEPVRPYAIVPMLEIDRLVTTSAPMMEEHSADVVQIWRYSDLALLHTIPVPPGQTPDGGPLAAAARYPFGPRLLPDGSIMMNSYGCGIYRLTEIDTGNPRLANVYTIDVPEPDRDGDTRGACSIPVVIDHYWIMPVGGVQAVIVLDISDPQQPREVSRLAFDSGFRPHWAAKDPNSSRIVVGAEFGGEQGMYLLNFRSGRLEFDDSIRSARGTPGYIDLAQENWPHGETGEAWGHAALFLAH